jgi:hypothetical protein
MGRNPIELDADAVLLVQVVQVPVTAAEPALGLALRPRQAMSAFHAVDVVAFQRGMHAVGGVLQRGRDPDAPAHPRPGGERFAERLR